MPSYKQAVEGCEQLRAMHYRYLMMPDKPLDCGLCKPPDDRTSGVCSKCIIVIGRLDRKRRRELYFSLDESQRGLMRRAFTVTTKKPSSLQERRRAAGLSQEELARKLEVTQAFLSQIEQGKKIIPERLEGRLAKLKI